MKLKLKLKTFLTKESEFGSDYYSAVGRQLFVDLLIRRLT